ncbi:MAG TPA: hypothetical protein PLV68_10680, partial [Ilumatobacteraceae bacterium]|nr:hypothetical protein [Ilumatobacteraceae bacterium]
LQQEHWRRWFAGAVGLAIAVQAFLRFEVFEHELLAGRVGGFGQRVAIMIALGLGAGVALATLVELLSSPGVAEREASADE